MKEPVINTGFASAMFIFTTVSRGCRFPERSFEPLAMDDARKIKVIEGSRNEGEGCVRGLQANGSSNKGGMKGGGGSTAD